MMVGLLAPARAGSFGRMLKGVLMNIFGRGSYLVPIFLASLALPITTGEWPSHPLRRILSGLAVLAFLPAGLSLFARWWDAANPGGRVGLLLAGWLEAGLGLLPAMLAAAAGFYLGVCGLLNLSPAFLFRLRPRFQRKEAEEETSPPPESGPLVEVPAGAVEDNGGSAAAAAEVPLPVPRRRSRRAAASEDLPGLDLLSEPPPPQPVEEEELDRLQARLRETLETFGVTLTRLSRQTGPVITRFELEPASGVKVSSFLTYHRDITRALSARACRILAPIPGKTTVGIEIPNPRPQLVAIREVLESPVFTSHPSPLAVAVGKTTIGEPYVADLASFPHALIAGATGSGKSVCLHAFLISLLMRNGPGRLKILLIDPKRSELPAYNGIPHLFLPGFPPQEAEVVTEPRQAGKALQGLISVMEKRYERLAEASCRNLEHFNRQVEPEERMPYIVAVVDELADLMLTYPRETQNAVARLSAKARAVGIHILLATQRPSVDIVTGLIKTNMPARISFKVIQQVDSRVILDQPGAEDLAGRGDMLFLAPSASEPVRLHGCFVSQEEVERVTEFWRSRGGPSYEEGLPEEVPVGFEDPDRRRRAEADLEAALRLIQERRRCSQDLLKAHFGSSARATDLLSLLEVQGFVRKPEGSNRWEINFERIERHLESLR